MKDSASKLQRKHRFNGIYLILLTLSISWIMLSQFVSVTDLRKQEAIPRKEALVKILQNSTTISHINDDFIYLQTNSSKNSKTFSGMQLNLTPNITTFKERKTFQKPWKLSNQFNCSNFDKTEENSTYFDNFKENKLEVIQFQSKRDYRIRYQKTEDKSESVSRKNANKQFRKGLETLNKLQRMQGWPGIPKLSKICIKDKENRDITNQLIPEAEAYSIKFVVSLPDINFPLCRPTVIADDCSSFKSLRKILKALLDSSHVALKIIKGFAVTFEQFQKLGAISTQLNLDDVIVTKDYDVIFRSFRSFAFLDLINMGGGQIRHQRSLIFDVFFAAQPDKRLAYSNKEIQHRLLADMSCRLSSDCPRFETHLRHEITKSCIEFQGHCDSQHRCWGVDASSHLCYLSRTLFPLLLQFIKPKWQGKIQWTRLDAALKCTSQSIPEQRCDWTSLKNVVDDLIKLEKT